MVPVDALALQFHDPDLERATMILPPVTGGPSAQPVSKEAGSVRALVGSAGVASQISGLQDAHASITQPGEAPGVSAVSGGAVHVMRRSLDARNNERIAEAAVTPQAFVSGVERAMAGHYDPLRSTTTLSVEEYASLEAACGDPTVRITTAAPRSYGPGMGPNVVDV